MNIERKKRIVGWIFLLLISSIISFWTFWGIVESFYEGWYYETFRENIYLTISRYLLPVWIILVPGLVSIFKPRIGAILFLLLGVYIAFYFSQLFFFVPVILVGMASWYSTLPSRKLSLTILLGMPFLTLLVFGIGPAVRVSNRYHITLDSLTVKIPDHTIVWSPPGPGWSIEPVDWYEADSICSHLDITGRVVMDTAMFIWHLPSIEEVVASTYWRGKPMEGAFDSIKLTTNFPETPDKEPPLWDPYSPIIYWWTSKEKDAHTAYMISFNGVIFGKEKNHKAGYYGFRAVKKNIK